VDFLQLLRPHLLLLLNFPVLGDSGWVGRTTHLKEVGVGGHLKLVEEGIRLLSSLENVGLQSSYSMNQTEF